MKFAPSHAFPGFETFSNQFNSVSGGLQTWQILKNSGPAALETPLSSLNLG